MFYTPLGGIVLLVSFFAFLASIVIGAVKTKKGKSWPSLKYTLPCYFLGGGFLALLYLALIPFFVESEDPNIAPKLCLLFWTSVILGLPFKQWIDVKEEQGEDVSFAIRFIYKLFMVGAVTAFACVVVLPVLVIVFFVSIYLVAFSWYVTGVEYAGFGIEHLLGRIVSLISGR